MERKIRKENKKGYSNTTIVNVKCGTPYISLNLFLYSKTTIDNVKSLVITS